MQNPSKARSGKTSLITDSQWKNFRIKDGETANDYFNRLYLPFLFTRKLFECLEEHTKKIADKLSGDEEKICLYSKEYITSYIIFALNEKRDTFCDWKYREECLNVDELDNIIKKWVSENIRIFSKNEEIDSNLYKRKVTYDTIKERISDDFDNSIQLLVTKREKT